MGSAMTKPSIIAPLRRVDLILIFVAVKGADWQAIEVKLEGLEAVYDPPGGPIENRIELSNF
jgi:hypothetical protein